MGPGLSSSDNPEGATAVAPSAVLMRAESFSKTFASTRVLHEVSLEIAAGEVRALLGQNGSGKSTFIKLLGGFHDPDPGSRLWLRGAAVAMPVDWQDGAGHGLSIMHQDLGLEPTLSITDNFMLTSSGWGTGLRPISWRSAHRRVRRALEEFGLSIDPASPVSGLSGPERAVVALVRALYQLGDQPGILVLDEPTASLEREAVEALFAAIRAARDRGCAVLFITHNLDEVLRLCDSVSVLRDGRLVAEGAISDFTEATLVSAVIGREIGELYPPPASPISTPVALSVRGLRGDIVRGVDLDLHEGEVLGVTGLAGMGQDELPMLIYGATGCHAGSVSLFGDSHRLDPRAALRAGMVLLPADRKMLGGDMAATVEDNLMLPVLDRYWRRGRLNRRAIRAEVDDVLRTFDVRPPDSQRKLGELSGGNQQKALLGKWIQLYGNARLMLLHEPTQGVDVGARQEIFRFIRAAADRGTSILYVSTEHEDLAHLCDRVLVMHDGGIVAELERPLDPAVIASLSLSSSGDLEVSDR